MNDSSLSHTRWNCQYQIVFIPKYRRKTMWGKVRGDVREIIKKLCEYKKVEIVERNDFYACATRRPHEATGT